MRADVLEYIELAKRRPGLDELYKGLSTLVEGLGFLQHAYVVIKPPKTLEMSDFLTHYPDGATVLTNYSSSWIERYDEANYLYVDPILKRAWLSYFPYRWDDIETDGAGGRRQRDLFDDAKSAGLVRGLTIPLHGPADGLSVLCLAGDLPEDAFEHCWQEHKGDLLTAAFYTHEFIISMATRPHELASLRLAPRETECLKWTAEGKTTWEISQILQISEDTTRSYLREASQKLGVHSKHHAVVKAIRAGLIQS